MAIRIVSIRALKDKLSAYLRGVQRGDVVLVTDRGRVVGELRQPTFGQHALERGKLRVGLPNTPQVYRSTGVQLAEGDIEAALAWARGDR